MSWTSTDQFTSVVVFTGAFALTYALWVHLSKRNGSERLPPTIGNLPIVGSIPYLPKIPEFHSFFLEKAYKIGDVIGFQTFHIYAVVLNSYDCIHEVLVKHSADSANRPYFFANELLNPECKGILDSYYNASFKKYHQLSLSILKEFGFGQSIMETRISLEVEDLLKSLRDLQGQPVNPKSLVAASVLSVISSVVVGDRMKDPETCSKLSQAVDDIFKCSNDIFLLEYVRSLRHLPNFKTKIEKMRNAQQTIMDIIEQKIVQYQSVDSSKAPQPESFISSFLTREGEQFEIEQLRYILRDFLLAGFETSSTTLIWIILTLANHQDVQKRLQKDLDAVVPGHRLPSLEDKSRLPYVEAVILEVMRYHTLVPTGLPHCAVQDIEINGLIIPKGTLIITNIYAAHMDKRTWDEPEIFNPERFLDSTGTKVINKERVISFSLGKRSCLGELLARQEIYLFITGLLQQFHIAPPEGVQHIEVEDIIQLTLQPSPFQVLFLPRN